MKTTEHRAIETPQAALHILALFNLAVAQPLFDLLSRNPEFLIVRDNRPSDVYLLILILCILFPLLMVILELLIGLFSKRLRQIVHALILIVLFSAASLPAWKRIQSLSGFGVISIAVLLGVAVVAAYFRIKAVRTFVSLLGLSILAVPLTFLVSSPISKMMLTPPNAVSVAHTKVKTPVVLIVLDELSLTSLLKKDLEIDSLRFPNFTRLRKDFLWFRNASTVADGTTTAVPAILDGMYPRKARMPTAVDHPHNLFSLLDSSYEVRAIEPLTKLCLTNQYQTPFKKRMLELLADLSAVYLQIIVPKDLAEGLPSVTENWGNFWVKRQQDSIVDRVGQFRRFVQSITSTEKPNLYFAHLLLPHEPWVFLPSGKRYNFHETDKVWKKEKWASERSFQRHLLQAAFTDKLIGELMDRLKSVGLYDRAVIIITADHGITFRHGTSHRETNQINSQDILSVPLFVKRPGDSEGSIRDRHVETIDIVPTIADVLNIRLPWPMDGFSVFNSRVPEHPKKSIFLKRGGQVLEFPPWLDILEISETVQRKLSLFGSGSTFDWIASDPHADLIGRSVGESRIQESADVTVRMETPTDYDHIDLKSDFIPVFISGQVLFRQKPPEQPTLAIAVNGIFRAVLPLEKNPSQFGAIVPESSFRSGKNEVEFFILPGGRAKQIWLAKKLGQDAA